MYFADGTLHPYIPITKTITTVQQRHVYDRPFSRSTIYDKINTCDRTKREIPEKRVTFDKILKIVVILDESGSMDSVRTKMIESINDLIKEQKQVKDRTATFTLVKFNDRVNRVIKNEILSDVSYISSEDYNPSGSTALYDAIADTINWFRDEKNVLVVIVTDGQENASRKYSKREVSDIIESKKQYDDWSFVYLSNDLKTAEQGKQLGLNISRNSSNCVLKQNDYGNFMANDLNIAITNYRTKGISVQSQLNRN